MSHDHSITMPPLPFTPTDYSTMTKDDVQAGWTIACLTGSIFTFGLLLYTVVMLGTWLLVSPVYNYR